MSPVGVCRSCGAAVQWVTMEGSGKPMPLDPKPDVDKGTIYVTSAGGRAIGRTMKGEELELARAGQAPLYVTHFATCPNAAAHRKPKARAA